MAQLNQSTQAAVRRLEVLGQVGWLSRQPLEFQSLVSQLGRWRHYRAREVVYLAGDEPDGLYGLADGVLEASFPLLGEEEVAVHRAEPGFWIGEAAALSNQTRFISLVAATSAKVFFVPAPALRRIVEDDPRNWRFIFEQTVNNQILAVTLLAEVLSLSPRARLARLVLRLADSEGAVAASQEDLSRLLGMTRSSIRRAIASLVESGIISSGYGKLAIEDRNRLAALTREA